MSSELKFLPGDKVEMIKLPGIACIVDQASLTRDLGNIYLVEYRNSGSGITVNKRCTENELRTLHRVDV